MIKAIIFDWGGVLGPPGNRVAAKILAEEFGYDEDAIFFTLDTLEDEYSTGPENAEYYINVIKKFKMPIPRLKDVLNNIPPWEVFDLAKELKQKGYAIYILSNQMKPRTDAIRRDNDLSFFDDVWFSNEIGMKKPDKKVFEFMLSKIGLPAEQCIFIDDNDYNVDAAKELGINVILFKNLKQLKNDFENFSVNVD